MSLSAIRWAMGQRVSSGAKLVLIVIADAADRDGAGCILSQNAIGETAGMDARTVRRHLADLEAAGLIERTRRNRRDGSRASDDYRLHLPDISPGSQPDISPGSQPDNMTASQPDNLAARECLPDNLSASGGNLPDNLSGLVPSVLEPITPYSPPNGEPHQGEQETAPKPKPRGSRFCPAEFEPDEKHRRLAAELHVDLPAELAKFRDHEFAKPKTHWDRAFANWIRNAKPNGNGKKPSNPNTVRWLTI